MTIVADSLSFWFPTGSRTIANFFTCKAITMFSMLKALLKQPYWVVALIIGSALVLGPCVTIDKDYHWATHSPTTVLPVAVGISLLVASALGFGATLWSQLSTKDVAGAGVDLTRVTEENGVVWTTVSGCTIRIVEGRIEEYTHASGVAIVLPCNEYFDDRCVEDGGSALGAFVNRAFDGQATAFVELMKQECRKQLGSGIEQQKTSQTRAESFGAGRCVLLTKPLGRSVSLALVSTTTQRAGQGLTARISYLFDGMCELATRLADERFSEVAMPILGAGHGGIDPPLAFVGLVLAVAEAARYGYWGQRLKSVTIVVFRRDASKPPQVDRLVVRRALALVGSPD